MAIDFTPQTEFSLPEFCSLISKWKHLLCNYQTWTMIIKRLPSLRNPLFGNFLPFTVRDSIVPEKNQYNSTTYLFSHVTGTAPLRDVKVCKMSKRVCS